LPRLVPIQTSFAAGQLTRRLRARTETRGYKEGASILQNMVSLPHGPAARRSGFAFTFEVPEVIESARIIPFPVAHDQYFIAVFTPLKLWLLSKAGEALAPELVLNSEFNAGAANWTTVAGGGATVIFGATTVSLFSSASTSAAVRQQVTGLTIGITYRLRAIQVSPIGSIRLRVGTAAGGFDLGQITSSSPSPFIDFVAAATSHWIECANPIASTTRTIASVSVTDPVAAPVPIATPYTLDMLNLLQYEIDPSGKTMVICAGETPVQTLVWNGGTSLTFSPAVFTSPPTDWTPTNAPRTVTFFQGRLWFGGTPTSLATFWGSRSNSYFDFTSGTLATDAITRTIAKRGGIRWMHGSVKNLLIGTESQELVISGGNLVIMTPDNTDYESQSAFGSLPIQPASLGNQVTFVSADGRKIFTMGYRFEENGWIATDLAFAAEDMTRDKIAVMTYAQNPESILYFLTGQGQLLGCSYDRGNKIVGWHLHPSQVTFRSIAAVKFLGTDIIWGAWKIDRSGSSIVQIGTMFSAPGAVFQDAYLRVTSLSATNLFTGFTHLRGKTVQVLADGAIHPDVTVTSAGEIFLQLPAKEVIAGFSNVARLVTMPVEPGQSPQGSETLYKRFNKAYVSVLSSSRPKINGVRPPDRTPSTPMDTREPFFSGNLFSVTLGWDQIETIEVLEDLPLPLIVAGIFGELAAETA